MSNAGFALTAWMADCGFREELKNLLKNLGATTAGELYAILSNNDQLSFLRSQVSESEYLNIVHLLLKSTVNLEPFRGGDDVDSWLEHYSFSAAFTDELKSEQGAGSVVDLKVLAADPELMEPLYTNMSKLECFKFEYLANLIVSSQDNTNAALPPPNAPPAPATSPPNPPAAPAARDERQMVQAEIQRLQKLEQEKARRQQDILNLELQLTNNCSIDIAFVLDCTGSMGVFIDKTRSSIKEFVDTLKRMHPNVTVRLAFVGYRDFTEKDRLAVEPFTHSVEDFIAIVGEQVARGGGDDAEDVIGGLHSASSLTWTSTHRILYLIGDAPCHGSEFHDDKCTDFHPQGDPYGLNVGDILKQLRADNVQMFFGKIRGERTDIMIRKFNELIGSPTNHIRETPITGENMMRVITEAVESAISLHISQSSRAGVDGSFVRELVPQQQQQQQSPPDFSSISSEQVMRYSMHYPVSLQHLVNEQLDKCVNDFPDSSFLTVKQHRVSFAKGGLRYAFYGKLLVSPTETYDIVFKEAIKDKDKDKDKTKDLTKHDYEKFLICHRAAKFLADEFNKVRPAACPSIHYVEAHIVQLNQRWPDQPVMIYEEAITSAFEKYNSNTGYVAPSPTKNNTHHEAVQAFSHWTHCVTNWQLMVVDCQGGYDALRQCFMLTDPAVHCTTTIRFGRTNLGEKGFGKFYASHRCNEYCRALGLTLPAAAKSS